MVCDRKPKRDKWTKKNGWINKSLAFVLGMLWSNPSMYALPAMQAGKGRDIIGQGEREKQGGGELSTKRSLSGMMGIGS